MANNKDGSTSSAQATKALPRPILELDNVSVSFRNENVLNRVSLKVYAGEKIAVVGPSGSGKSTLLKTLSGLTRPSQGKVFIDNQDFHSLPGAQQQKLLIRMGMLFQRNALFDSMKNDENVRFPLLETTRKSREEIEKIVMRFLEAVGIAHAKDLYPDEISGGMQKRLGIARAMALDPEIVFYDDPTAGLDPITSRKIVELIIQLQKERNSTVVAVTNDMNRAFQIADRIVIVFEDEVLETGSPEKTKRHSDPRVQQFIHGKAEGPLTAME